MFFIQVIKLCFNFVKVKKDMIRYIEAKSILSRLRCVDPYFGITYNMNLYRGCQHGCIYCDTRSECYGIGDISKLSVKKNALQLLVKELACKQKKKATVGTGSMNDPYMPVEKELGIVRNALKILSDARFPVHIITKSDLVTRDIDILCEISKIYAAVSITITTVDDILAKKIEPNASSPVSRFKAIELLASKGIYTGVTLMPVLPYINDTEQNIQLIIERSKDAGASYILPMFGMTMRKGSREYFYHALDLLFPGKKELYISNYGDRYECMSPNYSVLNSLYEKLIATSGISSRISFYQPPMNKQLSFY